VAGLNVVDPVMAEVAGALAVEPQGVLADAGEHEAPVTKDGRSLTGCHSRASGGRKLKCHSRSRPIGQSRSHMMPVYRRLRLAHRL